MEASLGGCPDFSEPPHVVHIGKRLRVREKHVEGFAEGSESFIELGPNILGLQHGKTLVEVGLILHTIEKAQCSLVTSLEARELVYLGLHRALHVLRRKNI